MCAGLVSFSVMGQVAWTMRGFLFLFLLLIMINGVVAPSVWFRTLEAFVRLWS